MNARKALLVAATTMVALLATACAIVPSAYRMDLWETSWLARELDGLPVVGRTTMTFNENGVDEVATIRTPCGTTSIGFGLDSDGDEISFADPEAIERLDCSSEQQIADDGFVAALEGVEGWSVQDDDHILLEGSRRLALTREPTSP